MLICPNCKSPLHKINNTYKCDNLHSFDIAKQGYTNLLINQSSKLKGDTKEMLEARLFIQERSLYTPLKDKIISIIPQVNKTLDIGCGIGYYTSFLNEKSEIVYGVDIAKDALKIASRNDKNTSYFVASNKELPFQSSSIDLVTNIFSPIYIEEVNRVLNEGYVLVVAPNFNHLIEMKEIIYDTIIPKDEERNNLSLLLHKEDNITYKKVLDREEISNLFLMTPHYYTSSLNGKNRLSQVDELEVTFDFNIKLYKKTTN